jgi:hypothetical protein
MSKHCVQYGRFRSHFAWRFAQVKQSLLAPPPAVLRRLFLGGGPAFVADGGSMGRCSGGASTADVILVGFNAAELVSPPPVIRKVALQQTHEGAQGQTIQEGKRELVRGHGDCCRN